MKLKYTTIILLVLSTKIFATTFPVAQEYTSADHYVSACIDINREDSDAENLCEAAAQQAYPSEIASESADYVIADSSSESFSN